MTDKIVTYFYDYHLKNQLSDVFYCSGDSHNAVATVEKDDITLIICCDGIMDFEHNHVRVRSNSDLEKAGIYTDDDIVKINEDQWRNNPWFDIYIQKIDTGYFYLGIEIEDYIGDNHCDMVSGDLNEAIKLAEQWIDNYVTNTRQLNKEKSQ